MESVYATQQIYCHKHNLISSVTLAVLVFEEGTLKASKIIALPMLTVGVTLFAAFVDTEIYYRVIISFFRNATNSKKV